MATAMQGAVLNPASVAERKCLDIITMNLVKDDANLWRYLAIWSEELNERLKASAPDNHCFATMAVARGRWAAELACKMRPSAFPESRLWLAKHIVDGWLARKYPTYTTLEDENFFLDAMLDWSPPDTQIMADALRRMLEFRFGSTPNAVPAILLANLLREAGSRKLLIEESVVRTAFKALGIYADATILIQAGSELCDRLQRG